MAATMASPRPLEGEVLERTSFSSLFTKVSLDPSTHT